LRVENPDARIPLEVLPVEGQYVREAVALHRRDKAGVVSLFSLHIAVKRDLSPKVKRSGGNSSRHWSSKE
jgi:hypothetical protein